MKLAIDLGGRRRDGERVEAVGQRALARDPKTLGDPMPNAWCLADDALAFLLEAAAELRPRTILELGSGRSTGALARELEGEQRIVSMESDPEALGKTRDSLSEGAPVDLHLAPIERLWVDKTPFKGYAFPPAAQATLEERGVDLVLVDGPSHRLASRDSTLYTIWRYLNPGAWVVIDDASRIDNELPSLAAWQRALGDRGSVYFFSSFERGLGLIVVPEGGRESELAPHRRERAWRWFQYARPRRT